VDLLYKNLPQEEDGVKAQTAAIIKQGYDMNLSRKVLMKLPLFYFSEMPRDYLFFNGKVRVHVKLSHPKNYIESSWDARAAEGLRLRVPHCWLNIPTIELSRPDMLNSFTRLLRFHQITYDNPRFVFNQQLITMKAAGGDAGGWEFGATIFPSHDPKALFYIVGVTEDEESKKESCQFKRHNIYSLSLESPLVAAAGGDELPTKWKYILGGGANCVLARNSFTSVFKGIKELKGYLADGSALRQELSLSTYKLEEMTLFVFKPPSSPFTSKSAPINLMIRFNELRKAPLRVCTLLLTKYSLYIDKAGTISHTH
jgi:hypothetical protein